MPSTQSVALLLIALFACSPAFSRLPPVVGVVLASKSAWAGTTTISDGSNVLSGEWVRTDEKGYLRLRVSSLQLALTASTTARIFRSGNKVAIDLQSGSIVYSSKLLALPLTIYAADVQFSPVLDQPATGVVEVLAPCEANVRVSQGSLQVAFGEKRHILTAGQRDTAATQYGVQFDTTKFSASIPLESSDPAFHGSHQHIACDAWRLKSPVRMPPAEKAVIAGVAVGTVITLIKALESPEGP